MGSARSGTFFYVHKNVNIKTNNKNSDKVQQKWACFANRNIGQIYSTHFFYLISVSLSSPCRGERYNQSLKRKFMILICVLRLLHFLKCFADSKFLGPLDMRGPVDLAGPVSEISPRSYFLCKNFDVFI